MGQQEKAKEFLNMVLSLPDFMGSHNEAQKYLEGQKN
jgi:hypothetical protein